MQTNNGHRRKRRTFPNAIVNVATVLLPFAFQIFCTQLASRTEKEGKKERDRMKDVKRARKRKRRNRERRKERDKQRKKQGKKKIKNPRKRETEEGKR